MSGEHPYALGQPTQEHYPDVVAAGSLATAVSAALTAAGSSLRAEDRLSISNSTTAYARVEDEGRFSQIYIARAVRMFFVDFWEDHVSLASYRSRELPDIVATLTSWFTDRLNASALAARHPGVVLSGNARSYENGTLIEDAWRRLLRCEMPHHFYGDLPRLIAEASTRPQLSTMLPFLSLARFCVSPRHYPTFDLPVVEARAGGRFVVTSYDGSTVFGEGDARAAVDLLIAEIRRSRVRVRSDLEPS